MTEVLKTAVERKPWLAIGGAAVILAGVIGVPVAHVIATDPERAYSAEYTDAGKCLHNTAYDESKNAGVLTREVDGQEVLTVVPKMANYLSPSVLNFVVDKDGFFDVKLQFADNATGALMAERCGVTSGY